jgi:hypothetical protein
VSLFADFEEAQRIAYSHDGAIAFGVGPAAIAKALRTFADEIEKGNVLPQSFRQTSLARADDYPYHALRIVFSDTKLGDIRGKYKRERVEGESPVLGAGLDFPIDVAKASDGSVKELY